jgi:C1A family cysteine protease
MKLGHNEMSDWTDSEFNSLLGRQPTVSTEEAHVEGELFVSRHADFNWQSKLESMRVIKNQGSCGSCWAFSTIGSVESATEISTGEYTSLSEQQLVDCSHNGNDGCGGGLYETAFRYLEHHGSETEERYPYVGSNGRC